ncbi:MAG: YraN family protein [Cyanobacteria bacterium QS_8_64_29]|nr:MAG: YraN family protein [Cyanobacteria bacterium QS_8_64_29]
MPASHPSETSLGAAGERVAAQWLTAQGWQVCNRRWRCRWGELDLIARHPAGAGMLAFVEVKTRSRGSWDAGGQLAVTPAEQRRIWHAAEAFLAHSPQLAELPCRFNLALVTSRYFRHPPAQPLPDATALGPPQLWQSYQLALQAYIPAAFGA